MLPEGSGLWDSFHNISRYFKNLTHRKRTRVSYTERRLFWDSEPCQCVRRILRCSSGTDVAVRITPSVCLGQCPPSILAGTIEFLCCLVMCMVEHPHGSQEDGLGELPKHSTRQVSVMHVHPCGIVLHVFSIGESNQSSWSNCFHKEHHSVPKSWALKDHELFVFLYASEDTSFKRIVLWESISTTTPACSMQLLPPVQTTSTLSKVDETQSSTSGSSRQHKF